MSHLAGVRVIRTKARTSQIQPQGHSKLATAPNQTPEPDSLQLQGFKVQIKGRVRARVACESRVLGPGAQALLPSPVLLVAMVWACLYLKLGWRFARLLNLSLA